MRSQKATWFSWGFQTALGLILGICFGLFRREVSQAQKWLKEERREAQEEINEVRRKAAANVDRVIKGSEDALKQMQQANQEAREEVTESSRRTLEKATQLTKESELMSMFTSEGYLLVIESRSGDVPPEHALDLIEQLYEGVKSGVDPNGPFGHRLIEVDIHFERLKRLLEDEP